MTLTCENLLTPSFFQLKKDRIIEDLEIINFLSFQDSLHYLIKACGLNGKKILLPSFYCDATLNDMKKNGLKPVLCPMNRKTLDVDVDVFNKITEEERPDIVLIYNVFGKKSALLENTEWKNFLKDDAIIICDWAHSLIPLYGAVSFLSDRNFIIDSTRKTTSCMMSHLVIPPGHTFKPECTTRISVFPFILRLLFFIKSTLLRISRVLNSRTIGKMGMKVFELHDGMIGTPPNAYKGFAWDSFLYKHIRFSKIKEKREELYQEYVSAFGTPAFREHIQLFEIPQEDIGNICFFFVSIKNINKIPDMLSAFEEAGYWPERLWNFDAMEDISESERDFGKSVIVFPLTIQTDQKDIKNMARIMQEFFSR